MVPKRKRQSKQIKSSLRISTVEGSWWAVMYGMVETYFGAFFEYLKYTSYEISILSTLPIFIGAVFQNLTGWFYDILRSRKTLLIILIHTNYYNSTNSFCWIFIRKLFFIIGFYLLVLCTCYVSDVSLDVLDGLLSSWSPEG